jgi:hypothetical protein
VSGRGLPLPNALTDGHIGRIQIRTAAMRSTVRARFTVTPDTALALCDDVDALVKYVRDLEADNMRLENRPDDADRREITDA